MIAQLKMTYENINHSDNFSLKTKFVVVPVSVPIPPIAEAYATDNKRHFSNLDALLHAIKKIYF